MQHPLLQLDLDAILKARLAPSRRWLLPRPITKALESTICQKELNRLLREAYPARGSEFSRRILDILGINVEVEGLDSLDPSRPYIFASNHPLGGLDGITLIAVLGEKYGDGNVRFLVNDLLMNVEPLSPVFLPINKYGSQGREAAKGINAAYASDARIVIFPAGLVSRKGEEGIRDLKWHKAFVAKALEYDREIVPVHFKALNRPRFYNIARWRKRLGIKINIEQVLLPAELCHSAGKSFHITFGTPVTPSRMRQSGKTPQQLADEIKALTYTL